MILSKTTLRHRPHWLAMTAAVVYSIAACGSTEPAVEDPDLSVDATAIEIVEASRSEVAATRLQIGLDLQDAVVDCMRSEGWEYQTVDENAEFEYAERFIRLVVEGDPGLDGQPTLTVTQALEEGLANEWVFSGPDLSAGSAANRDYASDLSVEEQVAYATSLDGCYTGAEEDIGAANFYTEADRAEQVQFDSWERVHSSSDVQSTIYEWGRCMRSQGLDPSPPHPATVREWFVQHSVAEVETLVDDAESLERYLTDLAKAEDAIEEASALCGTGEIVREFETLLDAEIEHSLESDFHDHDHDH